MFSAFAERQCSESLYIIHYSFHCILLVLCTMNFAIIVLFFLNMLQIQMKLQKKFFTLFWGYEFFCFHQNLITIRNNFKQLSVNAI